MMNNDDILTALQFAVIDAIGAKEISGRDLRAALAERGVRKSGPAFYQLMSRLEDGKLVSGKYRQKQVAGQSVTERRYRVTATGIKAWNRTRTFYIDNASASFNTGVIG